MEAYFPIYPYPYPPNGIPHISPSYHQHHRTSFTTADTDRQSSRMPAIPTSDLLVIT
jgi:hypothetical protein